MAGKEGACPQLSVLAWSIWSHTTPQHMIRRAQLEIWVQMPCPVYMASALQTLRSAEHLDGSQSRCRITREQCGSYNMWVLFWPGTRSYLDFLTCSVQAHGLLLCGGLRDQVFFPQISSTLDLHPHLPTPSFSLLPCRVARAGLRKARPSQRSASSRWGAQVRWTPRPRRCQPGPPLSIPTTSSCWPLTKSATCGVGRWDHRDPKGGSPRGMKLLMWVLSLQPQLSRGGVALGTEPINFSGRRWTQEKALSGGLAVRQPTLFRSNAPWDSRHPILHVHTAFTWIKHPRLYNCKKLARFGHAHLTSSSLLQDEMSCTPDAIDCTGHPFND